MSKNIEINYKSDVGYEVLYPMVQTSSLLPGTLLGQFVFDTAPKSNVAASADDELLRLGEGRNEIESYWLERYPWKLETTIMSTGDYSYIPIALERNLLDYYSIMIALNGISGAGGLTVVWGGDGMVSAQVGGEFVILWPTSNGMVTGTGFADGNMNCDKIEVTNYDISFTCSLKNRQIYVYTF